MSPRIRRELRTLGLAWCVLATASATLGGIIGWITWNNDPT